MIYNLIGKWNVLPTVVGYKFEELGKDLLFCGMSLGDVCPAVGGISFIKGDAVNAQELINSGKPVVLELFATWCGPCHNCIPHLSSMQEKFPSITFISVSCLSMTRDTPDVSKSLFKE